MAINFGKAFGSLGKTVGNVGKGVGKASIAAGGSFFGGLFSGATGGKLGGEATDSKSNNSVRGGIGSGGSFFGFSTSSNTRVNGPIATKDNCCCCDQTLSLLSSIDETLKRSLYVSQRLGLQNSEMLAEDKNNQRIAGLGGSAESMKDSAENVGFGLGKMILSALSLFALSNAGKILDPDKNKDGEFDLPSAAAGAAGGLLFGGKKKIVSAIAGGVVGGAPIEGLYEAKSTEGVVGGMAGNLGGGILGGMAAGALAGTFGAGPIGTFFGALLGGIAGGIFLEDAGEAIGDSIAGKFNEEVNGEKIGNDAASEFNKNTRGKRDPAIPKMPPGYGVLKNPPDYLPKTNINDMKSYMQSVARIEGPQHGGAKPHNLERSSASGRYGFLNEYQAIQSGKKPGLKTWDEYLIKVKPEAANYTPEQKYNMMKDPRIEDEVMMRFTEDNISKLAKKLGRNPTWDEVDMAHLLGVDAAFKFTKAYEKDPSTLARNVLDSSIIKANPELTAGSLQDMKNKRMRNSGAVSAASTILPKPLITPKTNTEQIDYFAVNNQPPRLPPPAGQGTVLLSAPAPVIQSPKPPSVPYPVDGPKLLGAPSQFWGGGWVRSM